jgi:hypothetical protein
MLIGIGYATDMRGEANIVFNMENIHPLRKDLPCKSLPRACRKANSLRR